MMNHRTRLDWLFFWNALAQLDPRLLFTLKIILKSALKNFPGAGWAMQSNGFIFLDRNWEKDEMLIREGCQYLLKTGYPYQVLIFPEGTDFCGKSRQKSEIFTSQNNLKVLEHVLQPRITGLACLIHEMMKDESLDCIYDVTIAYPDEIVQTEFDMALRGQCPSRVHFDVKRHDAADLRRAFFCGDGSNLQYAVTSWCRQVWSDKDAKLSRYYAGQSANERRFDSSPLAPPTFRHRAALFAALFAWLSLTLFFAYQSLTNSYCSAFLLVGLCLFKFIDYHCNGLERLLHRLELGDKIGDE